MEGWHLGYDAKRRVNDLLNPEILFFARTIAAIIDFLVSHLESGGQLSPLEVNYFGGIASA